MRQDTKHLEFRAGHWHYNRRVPSRYAAFDERARIRVSLKTTSLDTARERRDAMLEADDLYWASLSGLGDVNRCQDADRAQRIIAERRYMAANKRAMARGFTYAPADDLARMAELEELIARIKTVDTQNTGQSSSREQHEAEAMLGGAKPPPVLISEAFDIYCEEIAADELIGKSAAQKRLWRKTKKRGGQYLIDLIGDKPLLSGIAMSCLWTASAKDYGVYGETFEISEPDLLSQLAGRLAEAEANGTLDDLNAEMVAKTQERVRRPVPVAGVISATEYRSWLYDPSIIVQEDIADHRGVVFAHKGQRVNPLDQISLDKEYVFIDGDDVEQVRWATQKFRALEGRLSIILTNGAPLDLMDQHLVRFFFDQDGIVSGKFGVTQVPAVVRQEGKLLRIIEAPVTEIDGEAS